MLSLVLTALFNLSLDTLHEVAHETLHDKIPLEYVSTLSNQDQTDALRACLLVYILSSSTIIPRIFQLQASLATLNGNDTIITAGTGCGKTLCLLIPLLLRPGTISLTISPLKRLQTTQVRLCHSSHASHWCVLYLQVTESRKYGISTIAINEDTPSDPALWQVSYLVY